MDKIEQIFAALEKHTPFVTDLLGQDCCLKGSRIVAETLTVFGIPSRPLVVVTTAWNDLYVKKVEEFGGLAKTPEQQDQWFDEGCNAIGCGYMIERTPDGKITRRNPNRWAGHLIVIAGRDEQQYAIDLSLGQISRPESGIKLGPVFFEAETDFLSGAGPASIEVPQENCGPALVVYFAQVGKTTYKGTGWDRVNELRPIIDEMVRRVRMELRNN